MQFINKSHDAVHAQNSQAVFPLPLALARRRRAARLWRAVVTAPCDRTPRPARQPLHAAPQDRGLSMLLPTRAGASGWRARPPALRSGRRAWADARGRCVHAGTWPTTTPAANTTLLAVWTSRAVVSQHVPRARAVVRGPRGVAGSVRGGAGACGCVAALAHLRHRSAESRIVARKTAWSHHRGLTAAAAPMLDIFHFSMTQDTSSAPVRPHCASGARGSAPIGGRRVAGVLYYPGYTKILDIK